MLRLTRKADLAVLLLAHLAGREGVPSSARDLAAELLVPLPTASQILKRLSAAGLLVSERGTHGGYSLARTASQISLAEILRAIERPVGLTSCSPTVGGACEHERRCPARGPLRRLNLALDQMLERTNLAELAGQSPRKDGIG